MMNQMYNPYNEQELLSQIARGDQKAFSQIVTRYAGAIHSQLSVIVKDARKAQEVSQDVFMSIWNYRDKLPAMENFPGFVYVVTKNKVRQLKKKFIAMAELPEGNYQHPEPAMELKELALILHKGIELLPHKRKEVFKLSRMEGMNNDEIAGKLGLSKNTVREHIRESLAFLRTCVPQCFADLDYMQCRQRKRTNGEA